jgi:hypothetical protein
MSLNDLSTFVNDYRLEVDGTEFWAPYWRDQLPTVDHPAPQTGPYKGKGTPPQLLHNLQGYLKTSTQRKLKSPQAYRQLMRQLHLGVDCSGFAFYVLECWLTKQDIVLADHLFKPRTALLADFANPVYTHPARITRELLEAQPEQVPLSTIQEFWGNEPIRLAGVAILTSAAATVAVEAAGEIQIGDIIGMTGNDGIAHCMVIVGRTGDEVVYAHSARAAVDALGGVEYGRIKITTPEGGILQQDWDKPAIQRLRFAKHPVRRLKMVAAG